MNFILNKVMKAFQREVDWLTERAAQKGWGTEWSEIESRAVAEEFPNPLGRLARREEVADLVERGRLEVRAVPAWKEDVVQDLRGVYPRLDARGQRRRRRRLARS